jgi:hypothetical protein
MHSIGLLILLILSLQPHAELQAVWMIGYGEEQMLPLLEGGSLSFSVGETLVVKLLGRNGFLELKPPSGAAERFYVPDGYPRELRRFTPADVGEWVLTTDDGLTTRIKVEDIERMPSFTVSTNLKPEEVVFAASASTQGYALFMDNKWVDVVTAGSPVEIRLESLNISLARFDLLRNAGPLSYSGLLQRKPYSITIDQLVMSKLVQSKTVNNTSVFTVTLPEAGSVGTSGFRQLSYGPHVMRLVSTTDNRVLYEKEVVVVPKSLNVLPGLSRSVRIDFGTAAAKNLTLVVGNSLGDVWFVILRPPAATVSLYDSNHAEVLKNYSLSTPGPSWTDKDGLTKVIYFNNLVITDYSNLTYVIPRWEGEVFVKLPGASVKVPVAFSPGVHLNITLSLNRVVFRLIYPNGSIHVGPRSLELNGEVHSYPAEQPIFLPSQTYVARAVRPESFSATTYTVVSDTTLKVYVLDNPEALASLRVSALLTACLLVYVAYRTWTWRKSFYRARSL